MDRIWDLACKIPLFCLHTWWNKWLGSRLQIIFPQKTKGIAQLFSKFWNCCWEVSAIFNSSCEIKSLRTEWWDPTSPYWLLIGCLAGWPSGFIKRLSICVISGAVNFFQKSLPHKGYKIHQAASVLGVEQCKGAGSFNVEDVASPLTLGWALLPHLPQWQVSLGQKPVWLIFSTK